MSIWFVTFACRCVCVGRVSELEGVAEYSEPGLAPGPVTEELVTQRRPAPAAAHLICIVSSTVAINTIAGNDV